MIGNDIIDLQQSRLESNWQRKGFIEKLFTVEEQLLIKNNEQPEIMVWLLWSMKEAAYKIYNRETKIRAFIPQKLICNIRQQNDLFVSGNVTCDKNIYHTRAIVTKNFIHTIAVINENELNNVIEIERKEVVKDSNGIPFLSSSFNWQKPVSISHHGQFEKIVCLSS
ncbi:4'-phosphopantetheinyl transferase superfamily protein [Flavobacterium hercynium]|uniref:Phosphopantetheinyl transferase n=1 Tax=Flavobacterium hercynium TaxID=387094 RepID=A0A226H6Y6_9FLAO|nr:4'-phosphopantetheinyl transferase superfamily protein [Flavobacterium hercynium]OXA89962.1 phosphopantetheinyl transferase [Flavobacterium hercynium]SMP13944.1 4'-phosphopantetheinyl transferase superfamily protein [Flavobacterium hercynium]